MCYAQLRKVCVVVGYKSIIMKSLSFVKYYLIYFIYAVIYTTFGILSGEEGNTIAFMFALSIFLSLLIFLYNFFLTLIGFAIFKSFDFPIGPFIFPIAIGVIFNKQFIELISQLDMGVHRAYWLLILIALIINLATYFYTIKKYSKNTSSQK